MVFLGIDPGSNGGVVALDERCTPLTVEKLPRSYGALWSLLKTYSPTLGPIEGRSIYCYLESIPPVTYGNAGIPKSAVSSLAKLYGNYCAIRMALYSLDIPFTALKAREWQAKLSLLSPREKGMEKEAWKRELKKYAQKLLYNVPLTLATADAALLAFLCRKLHLVKP